MRRRDFIALLGSTTAAWPHAAWAQQLGGKTARIAYLGALSPTTLDPRQIEGFKAGLAENGLIEGQNIVVDYLWGEGSSERLQQLAAELARRDLDVIVTAGTQPLRALMATETKTPIVFAILSDPVGDGFIKGLARPGGNITGLSMAGTDLESKRLELLKDSVFSLANVMILHDPRRTALGEVQAAARALGLKSIVVEARDPAKYEDAFALARKRGANAVAGMASTTFNYRRKTLVALAANYRMPSIWESSAYVRDGGLLSYGPSFADMYRRSAAYVAKILAGQKPADLPVEQPVKFELALNRKTASNLGLSIPQSVLMRADEVIE